MLAFILVDPNFICIELYFILLHGAFEKLQFRKKSAVLVQLELLNSSYNTALINLTIYKVTDVFDWHRKRTVTRTDCIKKCKFGYFRILKLNRQWIKSIRISHWIYDWVFQNSR